MHFRAMKLFISGFGSSETILLSLELISNSFENKFLDHFFSKIKKSFFEKKKFWRSRAPKFFFLKKGIEQLNPISYISESAPPLRKVLFWFLTSGVHFWHFLENWKNTKIEIFRFWGAHARQNFCLKKLVNIGYIAEKKSPKSVL